MSDQHARRWIRFEPDARELAEVDYGPLDAPFTPCQYALVPEESPMGGCSLVLMRSEHLMVGAKLRVKLGPLAPVLSEIRWRRVIEDDIVRIGVQFLE